MKETTYYINEAQHQLLEDAEDLYNNAPVGYLSFFPDGTIFRINKRLLEWIGRDLNAVLNKLKFSDLFTMGGKIYYQNHFYPLLVMQGYVDEINFELITHDSLKPPKPVLVNGIAIKNEQGTIINFRATITDISDRKKYERQLLIEKQKVETEKKRFQLISELLPELVATTSYEGKIDFMNDQAVLYIGRQTNSLTDFLDSVHTTDRISSLMSWRRSVLNNTPFEKEIKIKNSIGQYQWFLVRAISYDDELSGKNKWLWIAINIQNQKQLLGKMDEFLSIASHELKTPLTTTKAYLQLLQRNYKEGILSSYIQKTTKQVDKLESLVGDLLDVSKIQAGQMILKFEPVSMNNFVQETVDSLRSFSETHELQMNLLIEDCIIKGDRMRLEQVLINLVNNAIKYSPGSKKVKIELFRHKRSVELAITDFGVGIPPEELKKLFDRFYRIATPFATSGLGIGLYISREIIKKHNGEIRVKSEVGQGSTFSVFLSLAE